ncbi:MAG: transferase [Desulfobacterium sp.]|nr:transferase [Desulfobacterium sp.]MBU3947345.1 transferase [Pseudomonadota bacterium]MBU4011521.1 transferase [Pseudomonadota bacterium]MBU4034973.1 transferase [Pseudomonadota bacterium]
MKQLEKLIKRIYYKVNINLRELGSFDAELYIREIVPINQLVKFYGFYGITSHHPLYFHFSNSNLAGSYFLGKCTVDNSVLYKSDIRGDELKKKGDILHFEGADIALDHDEKISIKNSFLIKTLVHNYSHDPENLEEFIIQNTASTSYANIHGSPVEGCFLGPFSTVDLTTLHDCLIGHFAYIQAGELIHQYVEPGSILISKTDEFDFSFNFSENILNQYISFEIGKKPQGIFIDFVENRKVDFEEVFNVVHRKLPMPVPFGASISRYSVFKGKNWIGENVLIAQRAYLENASLGKGSNAQENCYIIYSTLEGFNVTAHGAKIINANLGLRVFVGFNSFLHGKPGCALVIGKGSIVMPHTIIDLKEPVNIPSDYIVWGYIANQADLERHSMPLEKLSAIDGEIKLGAMKFTGSGSAFVKAFRDRIEHILEANGAFFDGSKFKGHAQKGQNIAYNIIQPYPMGVNKGLYPTIDITL